MKPIQKNQIFKTIIIGIVYLCGLAARSDCLPVSLVQRLYMEGTNQRELKGTQSQAQYLAGARYHLSPRYGAYLEWLLGASGYTGTSVAFPGQSRFGPSMRVRWAVFDQSGVHLSFLWEIMDHRWGANPLYFDRRGFFVGVYHEWSTFILDTYGEVFSVPHLVEGYPSFFRQNLQGSAVRGTGMEIRALLVEYAYQNRVNQWAYEYHEIRSGLVITNRQWWQIRAYYRVWTDQPHSRISGQEYQPYGLEAFVHWSH